MYNAADDNDLFALVKHDNELAYTELYNRYWQKLYFVAHKHLRSDAEAREIVIVRSVVHDRQKLEIVYFANN